MKEARTRLPGNHPITHPAAHPASRPATPSRVRPSLAQVRTRSELAALFRYLNIRAKRGLGQHFLADHNLLAFMVRCAQVGQEDLVLDIGCGTGLLTAHLADVAKTVIGIEVDRRLLAICSRYLEGRPNVELLSGDALASKHTLSPLLAEAVQKDLATGTYRSLRVVSNLPYSIASLVVPNLLESGWPIEGMVVTVQKEVAERMAANAGSGAYGALSVTVQAQARAELVRTVPPAVFWPRPKVDSAIVRIVPEPERRSGIRDYARFTLLVRAAFAHRRKTASNALAASHSFGEARAIEGALARCGIEPGARAEQIAVEQYVQIANLLAEHN
jgi:16S rRNA (adenine1518-N6/adenine1519-N6)-dimethyltransferase